ncbi:hypothetical protein [Methanobacterium spitsbergense]|uniref:Uncharacterized protein n=1 Tax=Methanobacterium spitsbergense TaxID=2874285 RepID=A0A8T5V1Z7_9EURY|nr:hypothetical protein [Methanobacterium spitsbergense]MBZ2166979.1 hypothetical protein [Methanobacterium spitsbergense]
MSMEGLANHLVRMVRRDILLDYGIDEDTERALNRLDNVQIDDKDLKMMLKKLKELNKDVST